MFRTRSSRFALLLLALLVLAAAGAMTALSALTAANGLPDIGVTVLAGALLAAACWRAFAGRCNAFPAVLEAVAGTWLLCYAALIGLRILEDWLTAQTRWAGAGVIAATLVYLASTVLAAEAVRSIRGADIDVPGDRASGGRASGRAAAARQPSKSRRSASVL